MGYASSSESTVRFGLGPDDFAKEIEIRWPGGGLQVLKNITADRVIQITETYP